jgi:alkylhydroperoxidase/carboxymuconolactone decarboxylase family protein YurZ
LIAKEGQMAKTRKTGGKVPKTYGLFLDRYPEIGAAWELLRKAEATGGLPEKTIRLIKLGIAIGGMKEGAVHSGVRKAVASGASRQEIEQVVAMAASTLGLPSTVAIYSWVLEQLEKD